MDYHEFKKAAENISSTSSDSSQKSAQVPTMSCTAAEREETPSENNSDEDGSWLFDQIDISGTKEFGEDYYQKAKALFIKYQNERSQNTVLLASTQAVYKAPHSTVRGHTHTHRVREDQHQTQVRHPHTGRSVDQ